MRHIMVINPKGGCGKTTLATNLAAAFASDGAHVALADFDPQESSLEWLDRRPESAAPIVGLAGWAEGLRYSPRRGDYLIMDAPAGARGPELTKLLNRAETILIPVLPSPIDMQATQHFIELLRERIKIQDRRIRLAVVANRVKENTTSFEELDDFLVKARVPYLTALRDAQNYVRAYTRGLGVYELPEYLAWPDWQQWVPIFDWLESRRSQAIAA